MLKKHIVFLGCTGAGKSTTINKILNRPLAKIGEGVDPQTQKILGHTSFPLILWDTPGIGENPEADESHINRINKFIGAKNYDFNKIMLVCESGKRDLDSIYKLINEVIKKNKLESKLILNLNQCDLAMKRNSWDYENNSPNYELNRFLIEQVRSFENRIKKSTGLHIKESIFYSAMFDFNINKLRDIILKS